MGLYDCYEPFPSLQCPRCTASLTGWQGKDGDCHQWLWRQGCREPVGQCVDPEWRSPGSARSLPARFQMATRCPSGHVVEALGEAPDGTWTRTMLITAPVRPRRDALGFWSCPCCGGFTLDEEPPGSLQICWVCAWEDASAQFDDPHLSDRANRVCLAEARRAYLRIDDGRT